MSEARHEAAQRWLTRSLSESMGSVPSVAIASEGVFVSGSGDEDLGPWSGQPQGDGAVLALEALGAISAGEVAHWLRRLELARAAEPPAPDPELAAAAARHLEELRSRDDMPRLSAAAGLFTHAGLANANQGLLTESLPREDSGATRAVVPAPLERRAGMCVTCVELRERGLVVHWHFVQQDGEDAPEGPRFEAADDVGTGYGDAIEASSSWGAAEDGPSGAYGRVEFPAPVPAAARTLTIRAGADFAIPLPAT